MTAIHVPGLLTFTIAILVFFAGAGLNRLIEPLRRWNIPEPVTGGLLAAVATLLAYVVLGVEISFTLDARDMLLLYFFTGIGLNARLGDLISGGRPLLILLGLTLVYLVLQNLIAAGSVAALGLPKGITAFVGSASLIGGHGTTIAWAPIITQRFGIANALEVGIATATLGLVVASLVGGPIAGFLIARYRLSGPSAPDPVVGLPDDHEHKPVDDLSHVTLLRTLLDPECGDPDRLCFGGDGRGDRDQTAVVRHLPSGRHRRHQYCSAVFSRASNGRRERARWR